MRFLLPLLVVAVAAVAPSPAQDDTPAPPVRLDGSCWPGRPGTDPRLCPPNDPKFSGRWEFLSRIPDEIDRTKMHPAELEQGSIGASIDAAWQLTLGRDEVVIAVLDSGIRWAYDDLAREIYLNAAELPPPAGHATHDANGDGVFDIEDYRHDPRVGDRNGNGLLDPGDLIRAFSDCRDDDANGYPDDIAGYDFFSNGRHCGFPAGDNDPEDATSFGHGTGIAGTAAAETNNAIRDAAVCPNCRVLPVRVGDSFVVDANRFARGLVFATRSGAVVIASALGSYNNTPMARDAVDFAYDHGVTIIASAADEYAYHHNYPSVYNHALYVNAIRHNGERDYRKASTFWGLNPCTNFGARVWVTMPANTCSSGATSRLAGVSGLVQSMALESGRGLLDAEEMYQVLRATADDLDNSEPDWGQQLWPARRGFDQLHGYGRVNALRAVESARDGRIPPVADLHGPKWFSIVSPRRSPTLGVHGSIRLPRAHRAEYALEYALGVEPTEEAYVPVAGGLVGPQGKVGLLGVVDFARVPLPAGRPPRSREDRDRYSVTLRLRVTDDRGLVSEARRSFFVLHDETWLPHFPLDLGASGEAGPLLHDLDGDGRDEVVVPTADGFLHVFGWGPAGVEELRIPFDAVPALDPAVNRAPQPVRRETVVRGAVIGDLLGDGLPRLVVASREGKVYAFSTRGERLAGFPVAIDPARAEPASPAQVVESGILSLPLLVDLDGRPGLEIVVTSMDGHVYAWRGNGAVVEGFPVAAENPVRGPGTRSRIVSSPVAADLDGDGRVEPIFGSNGVREDLAAAYAVRSRGHADPAGAFVTGWPFELSGLRPQILPTIGSGVPMSPIATDVDGDGDAEIILYAISGNQVLLVDQTARGPEVVATFSMRSDRSDDLVEMNFLSGTGSPWIADTDGNGIKELYAPLMPLRLLTLRSKPGIPLDAPTALGGWPLGVGSEGAVRMLEGYPRRMEDLMIFVRPTTADVDGDGVAEVLMGSGGYLLHGFRGAGGESTGFPKFTGGWIFSAAATGDVDGDGRLDVATVTREGYLFVWATGAEVGSVLSSSTTR